MGISLKVKRSSVKSATSSRSGGSTVQPEGRVARKRKARQEKMLSLSFQIVEENGVDGLTIKRLAEEMDLVMGAIYRYFPSKQELLQALRDRSLLRLDEELAGVSAELQVWLSEMGEGIVEVRGAVGVLAASRAYFRFHRKYPGEARILDALVSSPESLLQERASGEERLWAMLGAVAEEFGMALSGGVGLGEEYAKHAYVLWATLHGLGHFRKRDRDMPAPLRARELQPFAVDALLLGWGLSPSHLARAQQLLQLFTAN